ncbi:MAG: Chromate transport protein ChrA, partial [uncultured Microvirga sp.]
RLCRPAGGRNLWLAPARRDARRPRHGRDHARPAHHGDAVRRLHGRVPGAGRAQPLRGGDPGRVAHHLGDLRAVLPLDFSRRPLYRGSSRQPGALGGAGRHHGGGRRGDPQPRGLVRVARAVPRGAGGALARPDHGRHPGRRQPEPRVAGPDPCGRCGRLPVQDRHGAGARRLFGRGAAVLFRDGLGRV